MREAVPVNTQSLGHFATLPDIERGVQSNETGRDGRWLEEGGKEKWREMSGD